jgi:hypothetical protein
MRRRAKDGKKPPCPFCGSCTSSVYRSKGVISFDQYRRRRQCAECRKDWPTLEGLDLDLFVPELAAQGLRLEDLGLESAPGGDHAPQPMAPAPDASTWEQVFRLVHELWGDAQDARPYDRQQKRKWAALLTCLEREATRAGYQLVPR